VVGETQEGVGPGEFQGFALYVVFFLQLVAHLWLLSILFYLRDFVIMVCLCYI